MDSLTVYQRAEALRKNLQSLLGISVELKVNQNRKTVINVLEKRPGSLKMSIHEIFLEAPKDVLEAAARFLKGSKAKPCKLLHFYIHEKMNVRRTESVSLRSQITTKGAFVDLDEIWKEINEEYFESSLDVHISWFGRSNMRYRRSATLGQYDVTQNLIRVHRLLDDETVPLFYLKYIIYHEALHKLYPPYLDSRGILQIHHETFKFHEKGFKDYDRAIKWEQSAKIEWFAA